MRIIIAGATGLVGTTMLQILEERNFPVTEIIPIASAKSAGGNLEFKGRKFTILTFEDAIQREADIALFSCGGNLSKEWAPKFAAKGVFVIDNSSAWRMEKGIPLVVPEINGNTLTERDKIIANPNCSTIQMVLALSNIHKGFKIKRLIISTYQSVSGSGINALKQMEGEMENKPVDKVYPYEIAYNCLPHCDSFEENGYTKEEMKLINEPRKILNDNDIQISATAVRVPVSGGHSESVNVELERPFTIAEIRNTIKNTAGVILQDDPANNVYPMPLYAKGKNEVFVGRIREDLSNPHAFNVWIVADNIRKGAATNAVQIAELILKLIPAKA